MGDFLLEAARVIVHLLDVISTLFAGVVWLVIAAVIRVDYG